MMELPPGTALVLDDIEALRRDIAGIFTVANTTLDQPKAGYVRFRGRFLEDPTDSFAELRQRFEHYGFTPLLREEQGRPVLIAMPVVFQPAASGWILNLILFVLTVLSTLFIGTLSEVGTMEALRQNPLAGLPFSLSIMMILTAHEFGHYFAARYHNVAVTLPYFIPFPSVIGTMGAFIRIKAPFNNRRALLDVGAAGPLAGLVVAIPLLFYGLATSEVGPLPADGYMLEGNSIFYALAKIAVFGRFLPGGGMDVQLNQVAWAGWVGLLVTGLNLIPLGQLDGGHITYVLFGDRARQLFWPVIAGLAVIVLLTSTFMWVIWIVLLFALGRVYAEPLDNVTPLDGRRRFIAILSLVIFILVFIPVPLQVVQ